MRDFQPAWFLPGPHLQTIWGRLVRSRRLVTLRREAVDTPDGDQLVLDHLDADSPVHFVLMHGLEGSAHSVYMQGILDAIRKRGASATAMNFRSCARDLSTLFGTIPNRSPRFYHSGEITDFDFVLRLLAARMPGKRFVACGASLGGNALLKWLAAHPDHDLLSAAATISVPYDLGAGAAHLESGLGRWYVARFLKTLVKKVERVLREHPQTQSFLDLGRIRRARTFREFDDAATAPLHGFTDADDYYRRASSIFDIGRITTPTLCVSAADDPFLPPEVLHRLIATAPPSIEIVVTKSGGHTGFVGGTLPWRCVYWAEELVVDWLWSKAGAGRIAA
ncbi:MAG TPA: alpha/beta fold hydrolase [Thermoanaerobaculia bacterium]|nr:alpha/beta fold hydrolase [Thermoanaerobaculia bacterium]